MEQLMTMKETAAYLKVSVRHLQNMRKREDFPKPVVMGKGKKFYRQTDLEEFISGGGFGM